MAEVSDVLIRRKPWLAAFLSLLLPGLGHVYNGDGREGFMAIGVTVLARNMSAFLGNLSFLGLVVYFGFGLFWYFGLATHATLRARRLIAVRVEQLQRKRNHVYLVILLVVYGGLGLLQPHVRYRAFRIPSTSMQPTLLVGDFLIADTWKYRREAPPRGDVIIFDSPADERMFVQRCVAVAGDTVEIRNKVLYVNAEAVIEAYVQYTDQATRSPSEGPRDFMRSSVIPEGHVFVLGDHRDNSRDSRYWGPLPIGRVRAGAQYIYFSIDTTDGLWPPRIRWARLGHSIQ